MLTMHTQHPSFFARSIGESTEKVLILASIFCPLKAQEHELGIF